MFQKQTIKDIDIQSKTVLLRADYNVPVEGSKITSDFRIKQSLPTIEYLIENGCRIVICSHLGRPKSATDSQFSLFEVAKALSKLIDRPVSFVDDCIGDKRKDAIAKLKSGEVLLLENLRFYSEETDNDDGFAAKLAEGIDVFVQDGFGVVHRSNASTDAITKHLPSVAGLLLEKEVSTIADVMENPKKPLMAIVGGAKVSDKIDILNRFIDIADVVAIGGGMSNTFLLAEGYDVGASLAEKDNVAKAKEILAKARAKAAKTDFVFYIPQDGVVAKELDSKSKTRIVDWGTHTIAEIENYPKIPPNNDSLVGTDEKILDIGPFSAAFISGSMQLAETVVWNGSMGVTEVPSLEGPIGPFSHGTKLIVEAMLGQFGHKPNTIVGGGDTVGYIENKGLVDNFGHVSTGGGASLDLMSGKSLPGVQALLDK